MKLGCSSWSYHKAITAGRIDQREWMRRCARELELDGVELLDLHFPSTDLPYLRELKRWATGLHLTMSCASVSNDFGRPTLEERQAELEKVKRWVEIAQFLGAPILRVLAGWPPPEPSADPGGARPGIGGIVRRLTGLRPRSIKEALWPEMVERLRESASYAAEKGVVLALENHDRGGFTGTAQEVERCLAEVGSPWLRLCLDTGDYGDLRSIERTLSQAVHVHAKLFDLDDEGVEQRLDWERIMAILRAGHYRAFLSIEYEGDEDAETAVPRGVRYLRRLLSAS